MIINAKPLMVCSDGGAILDIGSYGSAISDGKSVIIGIMGKVPGFRPNLFQTEAYEMLARFQYLLNLIKFYDLTINSKLELWSDNLGLFKRIENNTSKHNPSTRK